ncbi:hypothetical protein O9K51_01561 [Purpureocillium lavendulum]|uniref:Uncharacterized protein n=1 Tax=Purpureocillium lavendulum TaxID=1247861 RepID=A0AB34G504_9HYPO|nr:hypothetical protein O9K51_01561 [Purpureocillium lavendulum]
MKSFLAISLLFLGAVTAAPAAESQDLENGYKPQTVYGNPECRKLPQELWHNMRSIKVVAPTYNSGCALYHDDAHTQIVPLHNNGEGWSDRIHNGKWNTFHSYNAQAGSICCWTNA